MIKNIPLVILGLIVTIKALFFIFFIIFGPIHLGPDEAQYWTWSRHLDIGYYSKPPAIAWQIFLGCLALGQTELGVRIGSVILSILIAFAMYRLARKCGLSKNGAAWSGLLMALTPLGMLSSLFAITDIGMVLFWILALTVCVENEKPDDYLLGVLIALGALFKWPIYFFWLVRFFYGRFNSKLFLGILISFLGLIPSLIWNSQHSWVTFRHVFYTLFPNKNNPSDHPGLNSGNLLEFIGSQAALLSPIFFIVFVISLVALFRHQKKTPYKIWFCGVSGTCLLLLACLIACFQRVQGNWVEFAYPGIILWIVWFITHKLKYSQGWLFSGIFIALVLCVFTLFIPTIQSQGLVAKTPISYRINPFRHNLGWDNLSTAMTNAGYDPNQHFLFSDKYQTTSISSFYGPTQKQAYFLNLQGMRLNQFSFWLGMPQEQIGKTGFFILADNLPKEASSLESKAAEYLQTLKPYFSSVIMKGPYPLFQAYGQTVKEAWIFECSHYNGLEPPSPNKF